MTNVGKVFAQAVREGKVEGFSIDPENPAMAYDAMEIDSPAGTKIRFTGYGGYERQQQHAREVLTVDGIYTVERTDIGDWSTLVYLKEVPGVGFNSVMFASVPSEGQ